jgi:hypothetical protein
MDRYSGKPLLRLAECYVLDAIGQLGPKDQDVLQAMTPKLAQTYGADGSWQEIVAEQVGLPPTAATQIRQFWTGYSEKVSSSGVSPDPEQFAQSFVDQNIPS